MGNAKLFSKINNKKIREVSDGKETYIRLSDNKELMKSLQTLLPGSNSRVSLDQSSQKNVTIPKQPFITKAHYYE
jgi:hypothetical protein